VEVNVLLDTNVLVYHVAGDPAATKFLDETIAHISIIPSFPYSWFPGFLIPIF